MSRNKDGPTARIIRLGHAAPGGVITWSEARSQYIAGSPSAKSQSSAGRQNFHMTLARVLRKYFFHAEGARGFYVLKSTVYNADDQVDSILELLGAA